MIKIKFNNKNTFNEVEFTRTSNRVTLKGLSEPNTSGFCTYRLTGQQLGDFSDYTTVYRIGSDYIEYSNDGSVYEDPVPLTEEELRKQALMTEKAELEAWLKAHDYIGVKIATGRATIDDYADEIALMTAKAERINEIDRELNSVN